MERFEEMENMSAKEKQDYLIEVTGVYRNLARERNNLIQRDSNLVKQRADNQEELKEVNILKGNMYALIKEILEYGLGE